MRVAVIGSWAPSLIKFRGPLLAAMVARGHDVTAMAPRAGAGAGADAPAGDAVVRLNPADVATVGDLTFGRELTIVADPSVEPAGAIVEVGACTIDAQIGPALARVRKALS